MEQISAKTLQSDYPKGTLILTNTGMMLVGLLPKDAISTPVNNNWPMTYPMMLTPTEEGAELRDLPVIENTVSVRDHAVVWTSPAPDKLWSAYLEHLTRKLNGVPDIIVKDAETNPV